MSSTPTLPPGTPPPSRRPMPSLPVTPRGGCARETRPTIPVDSGQRWQVLRTKPLTLPALWQEAGRARAPPDSATRQPQGQDCHHGAVSQPEHRLNVVRRQEEQRKTDAITAERTTPRMRTFLAE